jgi:DNA-binding NarL/FixJ family response regulator
VGTDDGFRIALIADDQRVVREGLQTLLGLLDGLVVVATAQDGAEAIAARCSAMPTWC